MDGPQIPMAQQNQTITTAQFAAKFRSKRECYNFLAGECEVYLPPYGKWHLINELKFLVS